jgi:hypothetical protein
MWQTLQKTVPSFSSGPSTLCPLPGQRSILGFVMDNRLPSNRTRCDWGKDSGDGGRLKEMATTLSRQVALSPVQAGGHDPGDQFKPRLGCVFQATTWAAPVLRERPGCPHCFLERPTGLGPPAVRLFGSGTNAEKDRSSGNWRHTVVAGKAKWKSGVESCRKGSRIRWQGLR